MTDQWPELQLLLPDLGSDVPRDQRESEQALTKGGRVKERKTEIAKRGQVVCRDCGRTKTAGLPCVCKEERL